MTACASAAATRCSRTSAHRIAWRCRGADSRETPNDLSSLLLLDVEAGVCERASRIEEAITAVQSFVRRARLGLEPGWTVSYGFAQLWDRRFTSFKVWEACKCRELYKENWIDWDELKEAQKVEAFRFLESELRRATVTIAAAGRTGVLAGSATCRAICALTRLQDRDPSSLLQIAPPREGLGLLGTPERDARPSWLAPLPGTQAPPGDIPGIVERGIAAVATPANAASPRRPAAVLDRGGDPARRAVLSDRGRRRAAGVGPLRAARTACEAGMLRRMRMRPSARWSTSTTSGCSTRDSSRRSTTPIRRPSRSSNRTTTTIPFTQDVDAVARPGAAARAARVAIVADRAAGVVPRAQR